MLDFYPDASPIKELKYKDFDFSKKKPTLKHKKFKNKKGMIMVYAPWCQHCKGFIDTWNELGMQYNYVFPLGAINAEDINNNNHELSASLSVGAYPTLFFVSKSGKLTKYKHNESRDELIYYISSKI